MSLFLSIATICRLGATLACAMACAMAGTVFAQQPMATRIAEAIALPAAAASQPPSTVSGATPPIERDSPRAALSLFFEATRAGPWDDAAHYLVLPEEQKPFAARLARRLKGVIDGHHWIGLETVSGASLGRRDDDLSPELEEFERVTVGAREESVRMTRVSDSRGSHWAFSPSIVGRIDIWYEQLPDRWREFQRCRQEVLLQFMQVVEEAGTAFAFPTRTVHIAGSLSA